MRLQDKTVWEIQTRSDMFFRQNVFWTHCIVKEIKITVFLVSHEKYDFKDRKQLLQYYQFET